MTEIEDKPVAILDHGELKDLRFQLDDLGVPYHSLNNHFERNIHTLPMPRALLISSAAFALGMNKLAPAIGAPAKPMRVIIAGKTSRTASRALNQVECDVFLQHPVHPTLLLLLVRRALFQGENRRCEERVAISSPVKFKLRFRSHPATLVDLSRGGCKLSSQYEVQPGSAITVILPRELTERRALKLTGSVAAGHDAGFRDQSEHAISVAFSDLDSEDRRAIARVMSKSGIAPTSKLQSKKRLFTDPPPTLSSAPATALSETSTPIPEKRRSTTTASRPAPTDQESPTAGHERRASERKRYSQTALVKTLSASIPLIGQDISLEGMRTEPNPNLKVGDRVGIVLYGKVETPVAVLHAQVSRDDGVAGLVFSFTDLNDERTRRLSALVKSLPILQSDPSCARPQPGVVIAEIDPSK